MTKQESFKKRVRARMATTGERYAEARRTLIERAGPPSGRVWSSPPEMSDDAIREGTGKGWNEWCDLIDGWPGRKDGHTAIAAYLRDDLGVDAWWSQGVTVGYERITGLRLPHQRADGTFTAGKSATTSIDSDTLRRLLLDGDARRELFPGVHTELKSKPESKSIRLTIGPGTAVISLDSRGNGRTKVAIQHSRLPDLDTVEEWKFYWSDWLQAIDEPDVGLDSDQ